MSEEPKCPKCGVEMNTALMAVFCPAAKDCEFWTPELEFFLGKLAPVGVSTKKCVPTSKGEALP